MKKRMKKNLILIIAISFFTMSYTLKKDYKNIIELFSDIGPIWIFVTILMSFVYNFLDVIFFRFYCRKIIKDYSFFSAFKVQQTGVFFSSITPFSSGGQFAQVIFLAKQKISSNYSASMLMLSFISWQTILVFFGFSILIFNYSDLNSTYSSFFSLVFLGFFINLAIISFLFLSAFSIKFHSFIFIKIIPFLGKIKVFKNIDEKKKSTKLWLNLFREEFNNLILNKKMLILRASIDIAKINLYYSIPFFCAKALGVDITIADFSIIFILTSFIFMITAFIPIPGAAGGSEAVFILLLSPVLGSAVTSTMLLWRFVTYYLPMIFGFVVFITSNETKGENK